MCELRSFIYLLVFTCQVISPNLLAAEENEFNSDNRNDKAKEKRGVGGVVDQVQGVHGHNTGVGSHNLVPIAVPVHVPVPRPFPIGIPKPIGIPIGVPVAVRVAIPKPYPVPVLLDPSATAGLEYGFGLYGHSGLQSLEYNHLLNYLTKSTHAHNNFGHLNVGHDQHSLAHYALSKLIH